MTIHVVHCLDDRDSDTGHDTIYFSRVLGATFDETSAEELGRSYHQQRLYPRVTPVEVA